MTIQRRTILFLGDGNFSFSLSFIKLLIHSQTDKCPSLQYIEYHNDDDITFEYVCTSFDSYDEVVEKYPESRKILDTLSDLPNVTVMHGINAWELRKHFPNTKFDYIIWNHPHLGTENYRLHRFLLAHFFNSAKSVLNSGNNSSSSVCLSLVEGQEERWELSQQASRSDLYPTPSTPCLFEEEQFPGYICKRNKNGQTFKNVHTKRHTLSAMKSFVYRFTNVDHSSDVLDETLVSRLSNIKIEQQQPTVLVNYDPQSRLMDRRMKRTLKGKLTVNNSNNSHDVILYKCPECEKSFPSKRGIQQHYHCVHELQLYACESETAVPLQCDKCKDGRLFNSQQDLKQHQLSRHSTLSPADRLLLFSTTASANDDGNNVSISDNRYIPCKVCGQAVREGERGMDLHLESLKPVIGLKIKCPICYSPTAAADSKTFMDHRALEQHWLQCKSK